LSSAAVGGGLATVAWVLNAGVRLDYDRVDLAVHVAEIAAEHGLTGPGVGLLTAAAVDRWQRGEDGGVVVDATVGIRQPTWAAAPDERRDAVTPARPGTINLVAQVPVPLSPAALVNAVMTVTEAKAQALWEAGVAGTGTASDAVCVLCPVVDPASDRAVDPARDPARELARDPTADPTADPGADPARDLAGDPAADPAAAPGAGEAFAGPRSVWGARLARAAHAAVQAGLRARADAGGRP
jgi:adenosylcobinamide amidohydrolase